MPTVLTWLSGLADQLEAAGDTERLAFAHEAMEAVKCARLGEPLRELEKWRHAGRPSDKRGWVVAKTREKFLVRPIVRGKVVKGAESSQFDLHKAVPEALRRADAIALIP